MKQKLFLWASLLFMGLASTQPTLAQDKWDGKTVATNFYSGTGTQSSPYIIRTGAQLSFFFNQLKSGVTYEGKYVRLSNDIDMSYKFCETGTFSGDFDGGKHSIEGLEVEFVKNLSGSIHDLKIMCSGYQPHAVNTINTTGYMYNCYVHVHSGPGSLGYFAALAIKNNGLIENCYASGYIHGNGEYGIGYQIAALVYQNYGVLRNCASQVSVYNYSGGDQSDVMAYSNTGTVEDCVQGTNSVTTMFDFTGNTCTVELIDLLHFTDDSSIERTKGQQIGTLPVPSYDCTFLGWYRNGESVNSTEIVNQNWTLFAKWEQRIKKQPTKKDMSVIVDDPSHASVTWFRLTEEPRYFADWQSTNHSRDSESSQTYTFSNCAGYNLSFQYVVSSEVADRFIAKMNENVLVSKGGEHTDSYSYVIPDNDTYILTLSYLKDDSESEGDDMVTVSNIKIAPSPEIVLSNEFTLPSNLMVDDYIYYCVVSYSNTGAEIISNYISTKIEHQEATSSLAISDASGLVGCNFTLPISLTNEDEITAMQFELSLPDGVNVTSAALTDRKNDHTIGYKQAANGNYQFTVFSGASKAFSGNEGVVANILLSVSNSMAAGNYTIQLKNIELTTTAAIAINPADQSATLTVSNIKLGDVNGDDKISITDAVGIVNYILGSPSATFHAEAADVNGDSKISITDAVAVVNIILNQSSSVKEHRMLEREREPQ